MELCGTRIGPLELFKHDQGTGRQHAGRHKHACRGEGMSKCTAMCADGAPCRAHALAGDEFCFTHHPARSEERAIARRAGGEARRATILPPPVPDRTLRSAGDVTALVSDAIGLVLKGELDSRSANTVGYLCSVLLKAIQVGELEERLARIEAAVRPGAVVGLVTREPGALHVMSEDLA